MKRAIIAIISVIMALSLFVACGEEPEPKKITGLTLPDRTVTYDGEAHSLAVEGNTEGCEIAYANNGQTEVGEYTVTATVTKEGYETLTLTGKLTIEAAEEPTPEFKDKTVKYNGGAQVIEVSGVPEGAVVEYDCNEYTKPGVYEVKAVVKIEGRDDIELTATFTIEKARLTVQVVNAEKQLYDPNPEFEFKFTGLQGTDEYVEPEEPQPPEEGGEEVQAEELPSGNGIFSGRLIATTDAEQYSEQGVYRVMPSGIESEYYDITFRAGNLTVKTYTTNLVKGGLQLNNKGETIYNGKEVVYLGVNYFSMWQHCFAGDGTGAIKEDQIQKVYDSLEVLASYNVKVIRFSAGFFYEQNWVNNWFGPNGEDYSDICMKTMERIFNKAASVDIGLVPSFFWTQEVRLCFEEDSWAEAVGNPDSKYRQFVKEFSQLMIDRFAEHPALFMWEMGNEWNLGMDVQGSESTLDINNSFRTFWSDYMYENDPYHRLIGSGDAELRKAQWHLWKGEGWANDTYAQHLEVMSKTNPENMSSISVHTYPGCDLHRIANSYNYHQDSNDYKNKIEQLRLMRNNPDAADQYAQELSRIISNYDQPGQIEPYFGTDASSQSTNLLEFCQYLTTLAKSLGKSCYIGEAGIGYTFGEVANRFATEENGYIYDLEYEEMALFLTAFAEAAQRTKLPMLIFWNYDHDAKPVERPFNYGYTKEDGSEVMIPIDRGSSTEYSWNEMYWTRGNNILRIIKNANDKYDSVTDVNSLGSLWSDADYDLSNFILDNRTEF